MTLNKQTGFTLVEVVIVIGLVALLLLVLGQIFFSNNQVYYSQTSELSINYSARQALDDIDAHVRQATSLVSNYSSYNTSATTLILEIQSIGSTNQLLPGVYDIVVVEYVGGRVVRHVFPSASSSRTAVTKELATNVTNLEFTYDSGDYASVNSVATTITLVEDALKDTRSITVNSSSSLRN